MIKNISKYMITVASLLLPINTLAYSEYIIPGGQSVGIEINTDGIMIVGFYKVDGKYNKGSTKLKAKDRIIKVGSTSVTTVDELVTAIEKEMIDGKVELTVVRDDKTIKTTIDLYYENGTYKTGLYVKSNITGIGTISYIDPNTLIYGALGHEIIESNTSSRVEVKTGSIFRSSITSIDRSVAGTPGGKNAKFYSSATYGNILKNTRVGIYGKYEDKLPNVDLTKVGKIETLKKGKAFIYTVLEDEKIEKFEIEITKIDVGSEIKNIYFDVTDERLLEKTGGIVQGMSGSPILQNGVIYGAVTHVVVSNPSSGYGISIVKMLEEGEN